MAETLDLSALATEQINPASVDLDARSTLDMLRVFNEEDKKVALAVERVLPQVAEAVDGVAERLRTGGRLFYIGAGTSGRLGVLDASECPPTFNVPPDMVTGIIAGGDAALKRATEASEDNPESGAKDLQAHGFTGRDALVGLAASGRTPYVLGALAHARSLGALTIAIACAPNSAVGQAADIAIEPVVGPEVVTGSTRLKSGTAQKLVLNMLSSGVMVRLGYVYSNLMVNVQPRNEKLVDRAQRIIMAIAEVDRARAADALAASGGSVRIGIVMVRLGLSREAAVARLEACGGRVREALKGDQA